jgi:hypothetical protein
MTPGSSGEKTRGRASDTRTERKATFGACNDPNAQGAIFIAIWGMPFDLSQTVQIFSCIVKGIGPNRPMPAKLLRAS